MAKVTLNIAIEGNEDEVERIMAAFAKALPETATIKSGEAGTLSDREMRQIRGFIAMNTPMR